MPTGCSDDTICLSKLQQFANRLRPLLAMQTQEYAFRRDEEVISCILNAARPFFYEQADRDAVLSKVRAPCAKPSCTLTLPLVSLFNIFCKMRRARGQESTNRCPFLCIYVAMALMLTTAPLSGKSMSWLQMLRCSSTCDPSWGRQHGTIPPADHLPLVLDFREG